MDDEAYDSTKIDKLGKAFKRQQQKQKE